jgi:GNAT superfamily N-acetyltransferase
MNFKLQSVLDYGLTKTASVLNLGFSDYFVPVQLDLFHFSDMVRVSTIDIGLSRVVFNDEKAVGVALIARRGWSSRLAAMSIIPDARRQKVGWWLMEQLIEEAKTRGDRRIDLEVIEQNEPAVKLYQKVGFRSIRRLLGYKTHQPEGEANQLVEIDLRELANLINLHGLQNLPWQLSGESLALKGPPNKAFQLGPSYAAITNPEADSIVVSSILTLPNERGKGYGAKLLRALFVKFPRKTWSIPAIYPEEIGGFFEALGFEIQELSQFQMELLLE